MGTWVWYLKNDGKLQTLSPNCKFMGNHSSFKMQLCGYERVNFISTVDLPGVILTDISKSFSATSKQQILAKKHVALVALKNMGIDKKTISIKFYKHVQSS